MVNKIITNSLLGPPSDTFSTSEELDQFYNAEKNHTEKIPDYLIDAYKKCADKQKKYIKNMYKSIKKEPKSKGLTGQFNTKNKIQKKLKTPFAEGITKVLLEYEQRKRATKHNNYRGNETSDANWFINAMSKHHLKIDYDWSSAYDSIYSADDTVDDMVAEKPAEEMHYGNLFEWI